MGRQDIQTEKVLAHMREHGGITPIEALNLYGCMRLASRISDLKRQGHVIERNMVSVTCADGTTTCVARYSLAEGE